MLFRSRGYGGSFVGPVVVDHGGHTAREVGDEPLLLARALPTVVARDRVAGAAAARAAGAGIIVMDDGFQNPSLAKHLVILMVDGTRGFGNGRVFPAGPLRAPLEVQVARAHAIVIVGAGAEATRAEAAGRSHRVPVFHGRLVPDSGVLSSLAGRPVLAFAGIGHPEKFFASLEAAGVMAPVRQRFPDHHRYTAGEAAALVREAESRGLTLLTTEKDLVRVSGDPAVSRLGQSARALPVTLVLHEQEDFREFVLARLGKA